MADTSSQKKVILTPATASMSCTGTLELKAVLSPPDTSIRVSIDGGGQNAHGNNTATLQYKPKTGDCGKADIPFTATAPGYEDGTAKVTVVKAVITNLESRVPIYRSQQENGSHRTNHLRFTTTPDGIKVKIGFKRLAGSKGSAKFLQNGKNVIEVTSSGETEVLIAGVTNSDVKDNLDVQIGVGEYLMTHKQFSVRTWVEGFGVNSISQNFPGQLDWDYGWRSESGTDQNKHLGDLDDKIFVGEIVRYPQPLTKPPYDNLGRAHNPTVRIGKAKNGSTPDVNTFPGFFKPYKADTNTATQKLGFWDLVLTPGKEPSDDNPREDDMQEFIDSTYNITRTIFKDGKWKFNIQKDSKTSSDYVLPNQ